MKDKVVSLPIKKIRLESDSQFDLKKVSLNLLTDGAVKSHGLFMEMDSLNSISGTVDLKPILCAYETDEEGNKTDFMGHEIEYQVTKSGKTVNIKTVYIEQPVGVLDGDTFKVETVDNSTWVSCEGYLYNEYCEDAVRILEDANNEKSVSIEFKILDGYDDKNDGLYHVTKLHFLGVTLLGDSHTPAITGANITAFTEEHNALFTMQFEKIVESVNRYKENKGGENVLKEELIEKYEHLKENECFETIVTNEEITVEEMEKQLFALSNKQITRAVVEELESNKFTKTYSWGETCEYSKYYLADLILSENLVIVEDNESSYCYYGIPFTMQGDKAVLEYDKAVRYVVGDWRKYEGNVEEIEVNTTLFNENNKINGTLEDKVKELNEVKAEFTDVKGELNVSNGELERLKKFEEEVLENQHKAKVSEITAEFEELKEIEGFEELVAEKSKDIEELRTSLKVFAYDNNIIVKKGKKKTFSTKEPSLIMTNEPVANQELTEAELRYGKDIKKYINNY